MKTGTWLRILSVLLLVGFSIPNLATSAPPNLRRPADPNQPPFQCYTQVWESLFKVSSVRFDRANNQVIWVLVAQKDTPLLAYDAVIADGDGVKLAIVGVKFSPNATSVKAGTSVQASVPIAYVNVTEVAKIIMRQRP